jgi:hypothetical protein
MILSQIYVVLSGCSGLIPLAMVSASYRIVSAKHGDSSTQHSDSITEHKCTC